MPTYNYNQTFTSASTIKYEGKFKGFLMRLDMKGQEYAWYEVNMSILHNVHSLPF